jgi:hypothetical protein
MHLSHFSLLYIIVLLIIPTILLSQSDQTATVNLSVSDHYTNAPIESAFVSIFYQDEFLDSAFTDASGNAGFTLSITAVHMEEMLPQTFSLSHNYPNPFDSETSVELTVPEEQTVQVLIYNILGQRVASERLSLSAGYYVLNLSLAHLPTGVYFLRVAGSESHTVKIMKMGRGIYAADRLLAVQPSSIHRRAILSKQAESYFTIHLYKDRYESKIITTSINQDTTISVPIERNNMVGFFVADDNDSKIEYELNISNEEINISIVTPDTLILKSGIYTVSGKTDTNKVDVNIEIVSIDTIFVLQIEDPDVPDEDPDELVSGPDLIAKALERGEIDYETSLVYRAYSLVGHPLLPEEYYGTSLALDDGTSLFREVIVNYDELSQETRDILDPFLARPNDPVSIFSNTTFEPEGLRKAVPKINNWISELAANGRARAWVPEDYPSAVSLLSMYIDIINEVWPELYGDGGIIELPIQDMPNIPTSDVNPDDAIDLYFVPINTIDPRRGDCVNDPGGKYCQFKDAAGWAVPDLPIMGSTSSGYIIIDITASGDFLVGTIAHELFHISQFGYDFNQTVWLTESTATWAEYTVLERVLRSSDHIRNRLNGLYNRLETHRLDAENPDIHPYSAYLYSLFAEMERGHLVVDAVWQEVKDGAYGTLAFDEAFPFREHFKDFALRNWNQYPVEPIYNEIDPVFPAIVPIISEEIKLPLESEIEIEVELLPLTMLYNRVSVLLNEDAIQMLRIDLSQLAANPDAGVDAIVTIEGQEPEVHRWTGESVVRFCLDYEPERVEEMVIIISNASLDSDLQAFIEFDTTDPCPAFAGTINYTRSVVGSFTNADGYLEEWGIKVTASISLELNYDGVFSSNPNQFVATSGSVSWTYDDQRRTLDVLCNGGTVTERYEAGGSGWYHFNEASSFLRFVLSWRDIEPNQYGLSLFNSTIGLGTGPMYQYFGRSTICGEWTEGTWHYFNFATHSIIYQPIPDDDIIIGSHTWNRDFAGVLPEIITVSWNLKRYFED